MFALTVRLVRKVPVTPSFHSSAVILGKKIRKKKFFYDFSDEMKDFDLSVHLQKTFAARHPPNWDQLKSSLIGLPANDYTLVNKINVDSILWEEIVKFGSFDLALKYSEDGQITSDKARHGLIKILSELPPCRSNQEYSVVKVAQEALAKDPEPWQALEVLGKTSQWRLAAEHVLKITDMDQDNFEDFQDENWSDSSKINDKFFKVNSTYHKQSLKLSAICSLILKASENKDFELVWNLMSCQCFGENLNIMRNNLPRNLMVYFDEVFMVWIDYCKTIRRKKGRDVAQEAMEKFYLLLQKKELFISDRLARELTCFYTSKEAKITKVLSINNDFSSKCQNCGGILSRFKIDDDCRERIMKILIDFVIKKDIYFKTSPLELQKFLDFLKKVEPFDLVVDQPNVSYKPLKQKLSTKYNQSRNLYESVKHFSDMGWNTLLVCRPEVRKFHHFRSLFDLPHVSLFILDANTEDDLFLLLAALHSGDHTHILTNDYLRQHLYQIALADPEAARIFFKWKAHRVICIDTYRGYEGAESSEDVKHPEPKFVWPQLHSSVAQQSIQTGHWHLPIIPEHNSNGLFLPRAWLCIKSDRPPPPESQSNIRNREQRNKKKLQIADLDLF